MASASQKDRAAGRAFLQPINVGRLTHAVAVVQLEADRPFDPRALREVVDSLLPAELAATYRQAVRQRVSTALVAYRERMVPQGWQFVAGEPIAGDIKLDLLWMTPAGHLVADELKSGGWPSTEYPAILRQCTMQCLAGREIYGDNFEMVRLVVPSALRVGEMTPSAVGEFRWL